MGKYRKPNPGAPKNTGPVLNHEQQNVLDFLKRVRFKKALFGVSEADVWKKLADLNRLYEASISAERARYDALLQQAKGTAETETACHEHE